MEDVVLELTDLAVCSACTISTKTHSSVGELSILIYRAFSSLFKILIKGCGGFYNGAVGGLGEKEKRA
jgi:hypothetical protein